MTTWFLGAALLLGAAGLYSATPAMASSSEEHSTVVRETEVPYWEPPADAENPPVPPPPDPARDRPPEVEQQRPPAPPGPGMLGPHARRGAQMGDRRHRPGPDVMGRLLPLIAERRPDLARRLLRMREQSPERFHRLLADALIMRLEEALEHEQHRPAAPGRQPPDGLRPPMAPDRPKWAEHDREIREQHEALEREMGELHRRNEELERRTRELAQRHRELRQRQERDVEAERNELRRQIEETVEEHFNVRTELRRIEFRHVEMELDRLRETVERIRHELERREEARGVIMERRIKQLLGEEAEGW